MSEEQAVKKGQLIMLLDESTESAQVQQSSTKINTRQQRVKSLEAKIAAINIKLKAADVDRKRDRSLADAKARKDFPKQIISAEFTGNAAQRQMCQAQILGQ